MSTPLRPSELDGFLAVDKPAGWTSHDVVARVRRLTGQRSVGHAGTLDPLATGLLPLGLGKATRLLEYLSDGHKRYEAGVRLGEATDTYDAEGRVTARAPWQHVDRAAVQSALAGFVGEIDQRPPIYSAIKRHGEPLYRLARRGELVEVAPRRVTISAMTLLTFAPPLIELAVECGAGVYVRSLAHDLGQALGTQAHLVALRRTRVGPLSLADAAPIEQLAGREEVLERLLAADRPVWRLPAVILGEAHARDVREGRRLPRTDRAAGLCRAYDVAGDFLALLRAEAASDCWQPYKVLIRAESPSSAAVASDRV